jgi:DNA-3-methyladenine glycosylase I
MTKTRCEWSGNDALMIDYHDTEWGSPLRDEQRLFEFLLLEGAQAGLSWQTVLNKRENYRKAFDNFDPEKIARYTEKKTEKLLQDPGIIRNKLKVAAAVTNAKIYLNIQQEVGSFHNYVWSFVDGEPIQNRWKSLKQVPATTAISDAMSKDFKKRGLKFVGSTICYAFMQATGMVNDHIISCFRHEEVKP